MTIALSLLTSLVVYYFRNNILELFFNNDAEINLSLQIKAIIDATRLPFIFFILLNSMQVALDGALKGSYEVVTALTLSSIGCLIFGIPLQIVLFSIRSNQMTGIWFGLSVGMLFICIGYYWTLASKDYEMASFNILKANEEQQKKKETRSSFDKILSYKAPPQKIAPS